MNEKRTIAEQTRPLAATKGSGTGKHRPFWNLLRLVIAAARS